MSNLFDDFETNELQQDATVAKIATVRQEGTRNIERQLEYYNLDAIISVGSGARILSRVD